MNQTLWDAYGIPHYPLPLKVEDRRRLFDEWMRSNPLLVEQMERWALMLDMRNGYVSVDHIFNKARFESDIAAVGVPFEDDSGKPHDSRREHEPQSEGTPCALAHGEPDQEQDRDRRAQGRRHA